MDPQINGFRIIDLCPFNLLCDIFECQKSHPRFMAGVCIKKLQEQCSQDPNCHLQHFTLKELRKNLQINPILGVYQFNLCKEQDKCKERRRCRYIHKMWAEKFCVYCLNDQCEQHSEQQQMKIEQDHKIMISLIEQKYMINGKIPNQICCCEQQCICPLESKNHLFLEKFCIKNFKGVCKYLKSCNKQHVEWEDIIHNSKIELDKPIIEICRARKWLLLDPLKITQLLGKKTVFNSIQQRIRLSQIKQTLDTFQNFDLIIILDCTGSMSQWISKAQDMVIQSIENFRNQYKGFFYRVGFVGFRDFTDKDNIVFHEMTSDTNTISNFILSQKAQGGGDAAEDVIGGIKQAMKLAISKHPSSLLCTILICDSPCHGKQYHDESITDNYKNQILPDTLENLIKEYSKIKTSNFLTCVQINNTTNKMYQIIKENFPDTEITSLSKPDQLKDICSTSILSTIQKSLKFDKIQNDQIFVKAKWRIPNFQSPLPQETPNDPKNIWESYIKDLDKNCIEGETTLRINIEPLQSDNYVPGVNSNVYVLFDTFHNKFMLSKIGRHSNNPLDQLKECKVRFYQSAFANQIAKAYRKQQIINNVRGMPVFYVQPILYQLEQPFDGLLDLYAEPYINIAEQWTKHTNNSKFVNQSSPFVSVFSHFTLQRSDYQFMVTDLQGKANILSDPSVQSIGEFSDYFQDLCNFNQEGIDKFKLNQHQQCYQQCLKLGLEIIDSNKELNNNGDMNDDDKVYQICQICQEIWSSTYVQYMDNYNRNECKNLCQECEDKCKISQRSICVCCEQEFLFNYQCEMIRLGYYPQKCINCENECQNVTEKQQKCTYCDRKCKLQLLKVKIGNQTQILCRKAIEFLKFIQCQKCQRDYQYDIYLDFINYEENEYKCKDCETIN